MAVVSPTEAGPETDGFSLTRGGPLYALERRLRLLPREPQNLGARFPLTAIALAWMPVLVLALPGRIMAGHWEPLLVRTEVHVRVVASLYLFLLSEGLLEARVRVAVRSLFEADVVPSGAQATLGITLARLVRLRDARLPELSLMALVYGISLIAYLGYLPPTALRWMVPTMHQAGFHWANATPACWWYLLVSQPLFLFVLTRWIFRWGLWTRLLWNLAKLSPRLDPGHADRVGGLGFLAHPLLALRFFVIGASVALCSVWLDEIARSKAEPAIFANDLVVFLGISLLLALLPYLRLTRVLMEGKFQGLVEYSALMRRYTDRFERRWVHSRKHDEEMLGNADFQSMTDLGTTFGVVHEMRPLIPSMGDLKVHLVVTLLPFLVIPIVHTKDTAKLIERVVQQLLGG